MLLQRLIPSIFGMGPFPVAGREGTHRAGQPGSPGRSGLLSRLGRFGGAAGPGGYRAARWRLLRTRGTHGKEPAGWVETGVGWAGGVGTEAH